MNPTDDKSDPSLNSPADPNKLYRWDGTQFQEAVFEKNADRRVPISEDAFQAAIAIRAQVQKQIRMRPDISIVVSAMIERAAADPEIVEAVAQYGLALYAQRTKPKPST
jgi:hypothetical protein